MLQRAGGKARPPSGYMRRTHTYTGTSKGSYTPKGIMLKEALSTSNTWLPLTVRHCVDLFRKIYLAQMWWRRITWRCREGANFAASPPQNSPRLPHGVTMIMLSLFRVRFWFHNTPLTPSLARPLCTTCLHP